MIIELKSKEYIEIIKSYLEKKHNIMLDLVEFKEYEPEYPLIFKEIKDE